MTVRITFAEKKNKLKDLYAATQAAHAASKAARKPSPEPPKPKGETMKIYRVSRMQESKRFGGIDRTVQGAFDTAEAARALVRNDLLAEFARDDFTKYRATERGKWARGYEVAATCYDGDKYWTFVEEMIVPVVPRAAFVPDEEEKARAEKRGETLPPATMTLWSVVSDLTEWDGRSMKKALGTFGTYDEAVEFAKTGGFGARDKSAFKEFEEWDKSERNGLYMVYAHTADNEEIEMWVEKLTVYCAAAA